jgi:NADH-ubiquinone oxidoreductase chain 5
LLIIFYINNESLTNGLFTIFQNRVGDLFFVLFMLLLLSISMRNNVILISSLILLVLGSFVKRAQFPFNAWLLSAIRAPTPISSLVHSSTLVVAGIFILLQFRYCLLDVVEFLKYIRICRLILRRFGLLNEIDIKKLIAYSTIRHVALIVYLLSFKLYKIVYFHLNIHAIFKSLIFICFGFVILTSFHSQDKRLISLNTLNPIIKIVYYFSCMCLAGLPFLRGFFSKDLVIEKIIEVNGEIFLVVLLLVFLSVRIYYAIKLLSFRSSLFTLNIVNKRFLGLRRVLLIMFVIVRIINIYLRFVFSLRLELFSNKIRIYFLIVMFFLLWLIFSLNFK